MLGKKFRLDVKKALINFKKETVEIDSPVIFMDDNILIYSKKNKESESPKIYKMIVNFDIKKYLDSDSEVFTIDLDDSTYLDECYFNGNEVVCMKLEMK